MSLDKDYICDYCGRPFTRKYNIETHIENCHLNSSCYCEICSQSFGSPAGLQLHLSRGHNRFGQGLPECDLCGRIFARRQNIVSHMITVHLQGNRYRCNSCQKTFTTEPILRRHVNQMHNPAVKYITCNDCNKLFKGKHSLIAHIKIKHNEGGKCSAECNLCGKVYRNNSSLKRHQEMMHYSRGLFKCDICPKMYTSKHNLRRHSRVHHRTEDEQYQPDLSQKAIERSFDDHIPSHHQPDKLNYKGDNLCEFCQKEYDNESELRRHVKTEHSFQDFYTFCRKSLLKSTNNKEKSQESSHACEYCNNNFTSLHDLKEHLKTHKECNVTCNVCFNKFLSQETLADHKKYCVQPKNVNPCSFCDKLFTDISSLNFHIRIFHPKNQISDCNISSSFSDNLKTSHNCKYCGKTYFSYKSLKHHLKLKHTQFDCECSEKSKKNRYSLDSRVKRNNYYTSNNKHSQIQAYRTKERIYQCKECNIDFKSQEKFENHIKFHKSTPKMSLPRCIICMKDFSARKTLQRHIKRFHCEFNINELITYGSKKQVFNVDCDACLKSFNDDYYLSIYHELKHSKDSIIFTCDVCTSSYTSLEYAIQKYKQTFNLAKNKLYLSELCTAEMSEVEESNEIMEPESTTSDIKLEPVIPEYDIKMERMSPDYG